MPKSIETSSEFDFSNEPSHPHPSNASVSSHGSGKEQQLPPQNLSMAVAAAAAAAASNCKKYRHQNYSKNIYIGTKNAEKWEKVRSVLSFKNDVEFVCYLLKLAEIDLADNNGLYSRESFESKALPLSSTGSGKMSKKGSHEKFTTDTDTDQESLSLPSSTFRGNTEAGGSLSSSLKNFERNSKAVKKVKRVQFQDGLPPGAGASPPHLAGRPNRPVTPTIIPGIPILAAARLFESASEFRRDSLDDDEVLDCRIAEKIKTELKEFKARSEGKDLSLVRDLNEELATDKGEYEDPTDNAEEEEEEMEEEEEEENKFIEGGATEFERALCLAAALKHSSDSTNKERPVKRKGRPPTKNKAKSFEAGASKKQRGQAKADVRKAPEINVDFKGKLEADSGESENDLSDDEEDQFHNNSENSMDSDKGAPNRPDCCFCDVIHLPQECPIRLTSSLIGDSIEKLRWMDENRDILDKIKPELEIDTIKPEDHEIGDLLEEDNPEEDLNDASSDEEEIPMDIKAEEASAQALLLKRKEEEDRLPSYCDATVPDQLEVVKSEVIGSKVTARTLIPKHTKLGPLVGQLVHMKDIPDDCTMKDLYEIHDGHKSYFLSTKNKNESNWLRYIRPAPTRDQRNVLVVWTGAPERDVCEVYFITCKDIGEGSELFYWSDHLNSAWGRKKIDKMNCGGCNLKFEHPLYYRTHCSVFHDPAFSLTIRKYHCKVCGLAVLGKDNIMLHATEQHEGKGAYQCQFCKKYFLRLNYLEMHRTYGCSANPQRARPLCDFCGRKFCQPQKLKMHIKRMHSADMADVLRDFQCKLCSKLLGSRAALQRHSKEVHSRNSAVVSCPRCQKLFQNRSNLKIHMLTHSGVRPFKCAEMGCSAAFTTKQCLQFHYKKVHGYTQEQMPKIERSIAYTFDAYSGGMKVDFLTEQLPRRRRKVADDSKSIMENFASAISERKRTKSSDGDIGDLCKSEPNLSLLSSKISSLLSQEFKHAKKLKKKIMLDAMTNNNPDSNSGQTLGGGGAVGSASGLSEDNLNAFKMRLFGSGGGNSQMDNRNEDMDEDEDDDQSKDSILGNTSNNAHNLVETFLNSSTGNGAHLGLDAQNSLQLLQSQLSEQNQNPFSTSNLSADNFNINALVRGKEFMTPTSAAILSSGLIQSKGSKKWMDNPSSNGSNELHMNPGQQHPVGGGAGGLLPVNRNFLSRLMGNGSQGSKFGNSCAVENDDEGSLLDVVDNQQNKNVNLSNPMTGSDHQQQHHPNFGNATSSFQDQISQLSNLSSLSQLPHSTTQFHQPNNFGHAYCQEQNSTDMGTANNGEMVSNGMATSPNADIGRIIGSVASGSGPVPGNASASLLVEAALNSVTHIIESSSNQVDNCPDSMKGRLNSRNESGMSESHENAQQTAIMNEDELESAHQLATNGDMGTSMGRNDSGSYNDDMQEIENEVKLMKSLNSFQMNPNSVGGGATTDNMQFPLSQQSSSSSTNGNNNNNPLTNTNADLMHENEIDVDNASTPRTIDRDSTSFRNYPPTTTPSPRDISPGQDYTQSQRPTDQQQLFGGGGAGVQSPIMSRANSYHMNDPMGATPSPVSVSNMNQHNSSPPIVPRYGFSLNDICRKREYGQVHQPALLLHQQQQHLSSDEDSIMAQNLSVQSGAANNSDLNQKLKGNNSHALQEHYNKYADHLNNSGADLSDMRLKYNSTEVASNMELVDHFQRLQAPPSHGGGNSNNPNHSASGNEQMNEIGLDMSSRISGYSHHNFQLSAAAAGLNRYHHNIYDILSEREQQQMQQEQQQQQQQQQESSLPYATHPQAQHMNEHSTNGMTGADPEASDQTTSVDLSRTTSYVVTSPPSIPYTGHPHSHSDMLRMVSMELSGANGGVAAAGNIIGSNNHRTFAQHNTRMDAMESLHHHHRLLTSAEQHRLLASNTAAAAEQLTNPSTNRLLVDPAHILMDSSNRHIVQGREFGSYHHHHHQVAAATNNYQHHGALHHPLARASTQSNHHSMGATNYHPFPTYY